MAEEEPEHLERIPWADLLPEVRRSRSWVTYAVIGALILAAMVFAATRRQVVAPTVTLALAESVPPAVTAAPLAVPEAPEPVPPLYSEADLMAVTPEDRRSVAGRAEWFVRDYFTAAQDGWSDVLQHLPGGAIPTEDRPQRGRSYVEWTQVLDLDELSPGAYEVLVAFRLLAPDGDRYERLPVRAVTVSIRLDEQGVPAVVDLPVPAHVPMGQIEESWGERADPPSDVMDRAVKSAGQWGSDTQLMWATRTDGRWRLVMTVEDEAGNPWPLAMWVDS